MKKKIRIILLFCLSLLILCTLVFAESYKAKVYAAVPNKTFQAWDPAPLVTPPENKHPRVLFTKENIPKIKENMTLGENIYAFEKLKGYANRDFSKLGGMPLGYSEEHLNIIEAQAFYYAVYKDDLNLKDEALSAGKRAVSGIDFIKAMDIGSVSDISRRWGRKLNVIAEVYDWCYDLLSEEQKITVPNLFREYGKNMEIWVAPAGGNAIDGAPSGQGSIVGHGSEAQLLRDMLSFAVAVYDERPDIWNYVGGRYYDEYVPARAFWTPSHYTHQGTSYGFYRQQYDNYAFLLITGMGAEEPYSGENLSKTGYSEVYFRRPDGEYFIDGDVYSSIIPPFTYRTTFADNMLMAYTLTDDPYLKGELLKRCFTQTNSGPEFNMNANVVLFLIYNKPEIQAKTLYDLPHSKYFPTPSGIMTARTGWEEGENSSVAAAVMKIGEYAFNNHQHLDSGSFQIYYKGILAADSGNYNSYADAEHALYTRKTVAHNSMLVFDPDEYVLLEGAPSIDHRWSPSANKYVLRSEHTNDGGQSAKYDFGEPNNMDTYNANDMQMASVVSHEIDPENTQKPYYTYIKGDLTNAYSDKVSEYMRSFMFLDLKNSEIPAALIVFDEITSSDAKFKKTWLLHGTEEPQLNMNTAVFENTAKGNMFDYGGRLELTALLPKQENLSTEVVGGPDEGWGIVRRWAYNDEKKDWKKTFEGSYDEATASENDENNTYRIEISPKTPSKKDYFFNVMLVSDAGKATGINTELIETENFYGTTVLDRAVFFASNGEENMEFKANLSGDYRYTVCDLKPGTYKVKDLNGSKEISVSKEGNVLSFDATGSVEAIWQSDLYTAPDDAEYEISDNTNVKVGDIFLSFNDCFIKNGQSFEVDVKAFAEALGYSVEISQDKCLIKDGIKTIASILPKAGKLVTSRGSCDLEAETVYENGTYYITVNDLISALSKSGEYCGFSDTIYFTELNNYEKDYYANIFKAEKNYNVYVTVKNPLNIDLYCGVFSGNRLVEAQKLIKYTNGYYACSFKEEMVENAENAEFKVFSWGDNLLPLNNVIRFKELKNDTENPDYVNIYSYADKTLVPSSSTLSIETFKDSFKFTKTSMSAESNVAFIHENNALYDKVFYFGSDDRMLHYSAYVKHISKSDAAEDFQFRLRVNDNKGNSGTRAVFLDNTPGKEYRVDIIVDLKNYMYYLYIDEKLYDSFDFTSWKNNYGDMYIPMFHFYLVSSAGASGGSFEVYAPQMVVYPASTDRETILRNLGNVIYK